MDRLPPLVSGSCLLLYWGAVIVKARRAARRGHGANVVPPEPVGRWLRLLWVPTIVTWCALPWLAVTREIRLPEVSPWLATSAFLGAFLCVLATTATFACWREMGKSWRIGIDPSEKTVLVLTGPFRFVRHPIYALSIVLVVGTAATVPHIAMLVVLLLHLALLQFEAAREEAYLLQKHGDEYRNYRARVGRFIPRLRSSA